MKSRPADSARASHDAVVLTATAGGGAGLPERARDFAAPLLADETNYTGEPLLAHADAVAAVLAEIGSSESVRAGAYLCYAAGQLNKPLEVIGKAFGAEYARLAVAAAKLERIQQRSRDGRGDGPADSERARAQTEIVRKMLLAFSRDLRVVLLRLASRLQTLRYCLSSKQPVSPSILRETDEVFAPLANRLGIWQIKWQLEDMVLRVKDPDTYHHVARLLNEKRAVREAKIEQRRREIETGLQAQGMSAQVFGRPKHISSIARKMKGKHLNFDHVFDVRALRIIVPEVSDCYNALDWIHQRYTPLPEEFDDYIAKPKINGYQSIHTVVRDQDCRNWEVQIRTQAMHQHAESGVAAHWAYKEAGAKGYAGVAAASEYDAKIAVVRQLLAWERDLSGAATTQGLFDDRIYVLTPEASVIELPAGATPVDFAYSVHTELGHRCRGARVDGAMVPLNTALQNGQTVEVVAAKSGGPSRDWLNADLGYLASPRARSKVRAWFNAQQLQHTIARGRDAVEKLLQREGRTAMSLEQLASTLGFKNADALFRTVGKDEMSLRTIRSALHPEAPAEAETDTSPVPLDASGKAVKDGAHDGVLVVGMDSLLTQAARCCKPAPPDSIGGYVTRGRGVTVHRKSCPVYQQLRTSQPQRIIPVSWGDRGKRSYPVDVVIDSTDRNGLLRDISDVLAREKISVVGVSTRSTKDLARMIFTVQVNDTQRLQQVMVEVEKVDGVLRARRH